MTAQDFTDILYFYETFKPQYIQYVDSVREMQKNQQMIDKFVSIENNYKDEVFNRIFENRISAINEKCKKIIDNYCGNSCKAHCENCCVFKCINESLLKDIDKVDNFKKSYQILLNTLNQTIRNILEVYKKADSRTQEHLKMCLDILHSYRYEMQCLLQLLETYRELPKNNFVLPHITLPKTPDIVPIPLKTSPKYGSNDEFWEEMLAQQKIFEIEFPYKKANPINSNKEEIPSVLISIDYSTQWKKYPEQMKEWAEIPKTVPELIRKFALEFQNKIPETNNIKKNNNEQSNCTIFISYSYDSVQHEQWIERFATELKNSGVEVIFDKWEMKLGQHLPNFMEQAVEKAQRVICILTPNYKKKADKLDGGVGFEYSIVTSEILKQICTTKFIPLLKSGDDNDAIPISLNGRKYLDMRNENDFKIKINELLNDIKN